MNSEPRRGQVWSLIPSSGIAPPPPVLLWEEPESGSFIEALPLLEESSLACHEDVSLTHDPDWLLGIRWCMARQSIKVDESRLRAYLTKVDSDVMGQVRAFRDGKECSLPISHRLVPALGDPRVEERAEYLSFVRDCAKAPLLVVIFTCAKEAFEGIIASIRMPDATEAIGLALSTLQQTAVRGSTSNEATVATQTMDAGSYKLRMRINRKDNYWLPTFEIISGEVVKASLSKEGQAFPLEQFESEWEPMEELPSGKGYLLTLSGPDGECEISLDFTEDEDQGE